MTLNLLWSVLPEPLVTGKEFSKPWREKGHEAGFAVCGLILDHRSDVVRLLEVVPSWRQESRRDLARQKRNIVQDDEQNDTSNDTVGDVV
jgi:hypothetical protein